MKQLYIWLLLSVQFGIAQSRIQPVVRLTQQNVTELGGTYQREITTQEAVSESPKEHFINFNPALYLTGEKAYWEIPYSLGNLAYATIFTVYQAENTASEQRIWQLMGKDSQASLTTRNVYNSDRNLSYEGGTAQIPILSTYTQFYTPKNRNEPTVAQQLIVGGATRETDAAFKGSIAEILVYGAVLKSEERQKIESSLALKYGITLTNGKNYLASDKTISWNTEKNLVFTHRVAGIGRDDAMGLYQKQSGSSAEPGILTLAAGESAPSNAQNTVTLDDRNFIVWGDNNAPLQTEEAQPAKNRPALLQRRWLIQLTGKTVANVSTQVLFTISGIVSQAARAEDYWLVIDPSGTGDFLPQNTRYIPADAVTPDGMLSFRNIAWDTDGSGTDLFTFAAKTPLQALLTAKTPISCENLYNGVLQYTVSGGLPPYTYQLSSKTGYNRQWRSDDEKETSSLIQNLAGGEYTLTATDSMGQQNSVSYVLENPVSIAINLGPDRILPTEEPLYLDASASHPAGTTYQWTSDNGFSSNAPSVSITQPGTYQVTATTLLGCTARDSITILESLIQSFSLYPNQSKDGNYQIEILLKADRNISVKVYDITSRLLTSMEGKNNRTYNFSGHISAGAGIYTIVLETPEEKISRKLIVE